MTWHDMTWHIIILCYISISTLTNSPLKPMPREPEAAATIAATSVIIWNAVWNLVLLIDSLNRGWWRVRVWMVVCGKWKLWESAELDSAKVNKAKGASNDNSYTCSYVCTIWRIFFALSLLISLRSLHHSFHFLIRTSFWMLCILMIYSCLCDNRG